MSLLLLLLLLIPSAARAEDPSGPDLPPEEMPAAAPDAVPAEAPDAVPAEAPDAVPAFDHDARDRPIRWWRYPAALGESLAFNGLLHLTTRYAFDFDWAHISWQTMVDPDRRQWTFDDNLFATNAFAHPYQGATYYTTARINDLTYLEAVPVVLLASWTWERFLETEPPSINDQVTTVWSGPFVGEVLWRLSSQVLDERATGGRRVLREVGAGLIDPVRGIERVVSGKAWRQGPAGTRVPVHHELALGADLIERDDDWRFGGRLHYTLAYGSALRHPTLKRPLDAFDLHLDVHDRSLRGGPGVALFMTGPLLGRRVDAFGQPDSTFLGLYQVTDFVQSRVYELGDTGLGPGMQSQLLLIGPWWLDLRGMLLFVPMGAVDSPYAEAEAGRSYVLGPGAIGQAQLTMSADRVGALYAEARATWIVSATAPRGHERVGLTRTGFVLDLGSPVGVGGELLWQDRVSRYAEHPDFHHEFLAVMAHGILEL